MNDNPYPLILVEDRYNGSYSGGKWLAFNLYPNEIPDEVFGDDISCSDFWGDDAVAVQNIGKGSTPDEAIEALKKLPNYKRW